jgi:lipopolysaccharide export system protein LptA
MLLCALCCSFVFAAGKKTRTVKRKEKPKTEDKRVYLVHADELFYEKWRNNDAQVLRGQVQFEHEGARLFCDSANFFEASNSFEAFGHVRMIQGDTLSLTSEYGYYDGNEQLLQALYNVVLKHRNTTLYTDSLYFDRIWNMGYYQEGGKMVDKKTTLVSDWGEYHTDTKIAIFYYDVRMKNGNALLRTDSLYYDTNTKLAHIVGPSNIYNGKSHIYSELGYYNTDTEQGELLKRSVINNEGRLLTGDSLWYDGKTGISEAFRNIAYNDTTNKNMMTGNYGYYEDNTGYSMCTDSAVAIDYSQGDSLYMHADTFKVFTYNIETDSVYRVVHAYNKVRAYRRDMQAVCDSLVYNQQDSCMTLYRDPIVWNLNQQLIGEEIRVYMKDSVLDWAHVINQAFSIEDLHERDVYNQLSSREMFAFFQDGKLHEAQAKDNVLVIYYPQDEADSSFVGMVNMETTLLRMFMNNGQLDRIWSPKSEGVMYPMTQIPPTKRFLDGFEWFDYVRPVSKEDIFIWRGKKAGTELKAVKRREAPLQKLSTAAP